MFGLAIERVRNPRGVAPLVRLCPRRPHGRPAAPVEQLELNAGGVDRARHQAAKRVDLADQMSLGRSANCRIARHERNRVAGQGAQPNAAIRVAPRHTRPQRPRARRRSQSRRTASSVALRARTPPRTGGRELLPDTELSKICRSRSSDVRVPTTSSSASAGLLQVGEHKLLSRLVVRSGTLCARTRLARACSSSATCRMFEMAAVSRSDSAPVNCLTIARRRSSSPSPVFADTVIASGRQLADLESFRRRYRGRLTSCSCNAATELCSDDPTVRDTIRQRTIHKQSLIVRCSGFAAIENDDEHIGDVARTHRSCDAFAFDDVVCIPPPCRIHQRDGDAVEIHLLRHEIARRAGNLGDDRAIGADKRVEYARLADVGPSDRRRQRRRRESGVRAGHRRAACPTAR